MEGEEKRARGEGDERGERDRGWWREELKHSKSKLHIHSTNFRRHTVTTTYIRTHAQHNRALLWTTPTAAAARPGDVLTTAAH